MTALAFALALSAQQGPTATPPPWYGSAGRLVTMSTLHVGVRPAAFVDNEGDGGRLEVGVGITLQLTAGW